jgi:purine nucleosidase
VRPILLDTDIGSDCDDALALGVLLAERAALELVAVTTGSAKSDRRAEIVASLLGVAGREGVDICIGDRAGLARSEERYNWMGHEDDCILPGARAPISDEPAAERIVRAARECEGLEIVMIGPMTNLARALALDRSLPGRVRGVTIMGGHIREARLGGYVCPFGIDYNLCSDPEGSMAVLGAGFRTTLVSADVTLQTWLRRQDLDRMHEAGPLARELARQVELWEPVQRTLFTSIGGDVADDNVAFLHDPLTVLALVDESALEFESLSILPTIEGGVLRTIEADPSWGVGAQMRVATRVDPDTARNAILQRLLHA